MKKILNWKVVVGVLALLVLLAIATPFVLSWLEFERMACARRREVVPLVLTEMASLHLVLREYRKEHGRYPEGDSRAIIRAMKGDMIIPAGKLLPDDSLLDPWKTPYVIRIVPGKEIELRSAGPDRKFGTPDDFVDIQQIEP